MSGIERVNLEDALTAVKRCWSNQFELAEDGGTYLPVENKKRERKLRKIRDILESML